MVSKISSVGVARPSHMPRYWPVPSSCKVYWEMQQDYPSNTIKDLSGNGNDGTNSGADWVQIEDGLWTKNFVPANNDSIFKNSFTSITAYPFTLMAWMNQDATHAGAVIGIFDASDATQFYVVGVNGDAHTIWSTGGFSDAGTIDISSGYHFLCGVFTDNTHRYLYTDGVLETTATDDVTPAGIDRFAVGRFMDSTPVATFDGKITLPKAFNVSLSAEQVMGFYQRERHLFNA